MNSFQKVAAATSSATLRIASIIFLRWIPGQPFPPVILSAFAIYLTTLSTLAWPHLPKHVNTSRETRVNSDEKPSALEEFRARVQLIRERDGPASFLRTLLTGLPSRKSSLATRITVAINVVLVLFTLDLLFRGVIFYPATDLTFSRIGYVSPTTAKLLVREPDRAQLPLIVYSQEQEHQGDDSWVVQDVIYLLDDATDFTTPVTLKELKPSTKYRYSLSNNLTGSFTTAPLPGSASANQLTFLTSSCIKPNFPYSPLSHPLRIPGIAHVSNVVAKLPSLFKPAFMLFLGDFIYVDVPFRVGSSASHYRSEYRRVYSSPTWREPKENPIINLPWIHALDDHEIANDWAEGNATPPYPAAVDPFAHYHVSVNPPIPLAPFAGPENTTYFSFTHGPASFFIQDTRTYRSRQDSTILGSAQLQSLLAYLARPEPADVKWKIIGSSVPFTKNWRVGTQDTWGGFLDERRTVLEAMWQAERELGVRIVLLSGDRHEFGATRFPNPELDLEPDGLRPGTGGEGIHEFSVGPLNMFYLPFRSYRQTDNEDVMVKYIPDGNTKFGQIDIAVHNLQEPFPSSSITPSSVLTYSLWLDETVVWKYQLSIPLHHGLGTRLPPGWVLLDKTQGVQDVVTCE